MKEIDLTPYKYINDVRHTLIDDEWQPETEESFLLRMKDAESIEWNDLARAEKELPVFDDCIKDRRDIRAALEGIAAGGKMLVVTAKAGFPTWIDFNTHALRRCKAVKELYLKAKEERYNRRLHEAEEALYDGGVEGVDEPIINHLGQIVGYKKRYSDRLLEVQLKALDPEKYSDKKDVNVKGLVIQANMGLRDNQDKPVNEQEFTGLHVLDDEESDD